MNAYFYQLVEGDINTTVGVGFNGTKLFSYPYALINSENEMVIACVTENTAESLLKTSRYGACAIFELAKLPQEIMDCAKDRNFDTLDQIQEFVTEGYKETTEYKISHLEENLGLTFDIEKATLEEYQEYRQEENKTALAKYLKDNPILWTDDKYYGVTQEDQIEMQTDLTAYNLKQQSGETDWKLEWHDIKKACREFTVEEFMRLMNAIVDYVYPLRRLQESYKELIYTTSDKSQLASLQFNYDIDEPEDTSEEPSTEANSNETKEEPVVVDTTDETKEEPVVVDTTDETEDTSEEPSTEANSDKTEEEPVVVDTIDEDVTDTSEVSE